MGTVSPINGHIDYTWPEWISVDFKLPENEGCYLCVNHMPGWKPNIQLCQFSKDLYQLDSYDFSDKKGKVGWCEYDSEWGWYECDHITHWMPLPSLP